MLIKKINKHKTTATLMFDNNEKLNVGLVVLNDFSLYEGKEITPEQYEEIVYCNLFLIGLNARQKKLYSEQEMMDLLIKNKATTKQINKIIDRMKELDLIDDYALSLELHAYYDEKNYGKHYIVNKLKNKGIASSIIKENEFPYEIEIEKANNFLYKLNNKTSGRNDASFKRSVYNKLVCHGFDSEVINEVLKDIIDL